MTLAFVVTDDLWSHAPSRGAVVTIGQPSHMGSPLRYLWMLRFGWQSEGFYSRIGDHKPSCGRFSSRFLRVPPFAVLTPGMLIPFPLIAMGRVAA
ncbi:hypothetical protein [Dictyobacter formicarum]|uniref:hypothetical protein n=1 Tax=Dictyobacter formicarum TaxID=2778368 RepID=UPI0019151785|nr:hypothetical protein [Dictyobacter formicarum]